jgi:hypothetical protein
VPASAAKSNQTIDCTAYLTEQPGGTELKGADKGPLFCSGPFGAGTQSDTFTMVFNSTMTGGTGVVKWTDIYKRGTVSDVWTLNFTVSGMAVALHYAVKYARGTGAYKGIKASGAGAGNLTSMTTGTFTYAVTV